MQMAYLVASRSTCARRSVGCVLVDHNDFVLATGFNGVPSGHPHCNDDRTAEGLCVGAGFESGHRLESCMAIHAEQNALLQCHDTQRISAAYVTTSPCVFCVRMLLNTSCDVIIFSEEYPMPEAKDMWLKAEKKSPLGINYPRIWRQHAVTRPDFRT